MSRNQSLRDIVASRPFDVRYTVLPPGLSSSRLPAHTATACESCLHHFNGLVVSRYVGPEVSWLTSGTELALASPLTRTCLCATLTCGILRPPPGHMCSSRSGGSQGRGEIDPTSADAMIPNPVRSYDSQLRHDALDHRPVHVGQTKLSTRVSISQPLVIKSQQMQQRGV